MNIGIFGGTFNPPHLGHLIVAEHVREKLGLDRIRYIPSAIPPHKQNQDIVEAHHRLAMLEHAVQGNRQFEVSDMEIQRGGVSFTVDTLNETKKLSPDDHLFMLIGMDNLNEFQTWKNPEHILAVATVVVMTRPGFQFRNEDVELRTKITVCEVPEIAITSSAIRAKVRDRKSIRYLVPAAVELYIYRHHLYQDGPKE
jgi:nicotinate-nucleotide adenylyltransferase